LSLEHRVGIPSQIFGELWLPDEDATIQEAVALSVDVTLLWLDLLSDFKREILSPSFRRSALNVACDQRNVKISGERLEASEMAEKMNTGVGRCGWWLRFAE